MTAVVLFIGVGLLLIGAAIPRFGLPLFCGLLLAISLLVSYFPNTVPFSSVVISTVFLLLGYTGRILFADIASAIYQAGIFTVARSSGWAFLYSCPLFVVIWLLADIHDWRDRTIYYGCEGSNDQSEPAWAQLDHDGLYNAKRPNGSALYGREEDGNFYLLSRVNEGQTLFGQMFESFPNWMRDPITSLPIDPLECPPARAEADHEASAIATANAYADQTRSILMQRVETTLASAETEFDQSEVAIRRILFGSDEDWKGTTRERWEQPGSATPLCATNAIFPGNLECQPEGLGPITRCRGWLRSPGSCMQRRIQKPIYRAYHDRRDKLERDIRELGSNISHTGESGADSVRRVAQRFVDTEIEEARTQAISSIQRSFFYWNLISWILFTIVCMTTLKVFIFLLARFLFSQNTRGGRAQLRFCSANQNPIPFTSEAVPIDGNGNIRFHSQITKWFAFRRSGVNWTSPQKGIFFFKIQQSYLRRLLVGKGSTSVYTDTPPAGSSAITRPLRWIKIQQGQELVVDLKYLAAISDGIVFRTMFIPRLSAFLQRGLFFTVICGEGEILLSCEGGRSVISEVDVEPHRIIAMDRFGTFECYAPLEGFDPYWHPFTIGPTNKTMIATFAPEDAGNESTLKTVGTYIRKALFFVLPI